VSVILPFPRSRHSSFVIRHARRMAELSRDAGEKYLSQQLDIQAETMRRRGVAPELVEEECNRLEVAIRSMFRHVVLRQPGGVV
jgi:hypothetical protein